MIEGLIERLRGLVPDGSTVPFVTDLPPLPDHVTWYLARSTGVVAWAGLTASVCLGLALSTRALGKRPTPAWLTDLHRGVSASALIVTAVHLAALVADEYVEFGPRELLVPMASTWKPGAVTLGVVGVYLMVLVEASSFARRRISARLWRTLHLLAFPAWVLATAHFMTAGTDAERPWLAGSVIGSMVLVGGLLLVRILVPRGRAAAGRRERRAAEPSVARAGERTADERPADEPMERTTAPVG